MPAGVSFAQGNRKDSKVLPRLKRDPRSANRAAVLAKESDGRQPADQNQIIHENFSGAESSRSRGRLSLEISAPPKEVRACSPSPFLPRLIFMRSRCCATKSFARMRWRCANSTARKPAMYVIAGGSTPRPCGSCKRRGFSYAVITPNIKRHTQSG